MPLVRIFTYFLVSKALLYIYVSQVLERTPMFYYLGSKTSLMVKARFGTKMWRACTMLNPFDFKVYLNSSHRIMHIWSNQRAQYASSLVKLYHCSDAHESIERIVWANSMIFGENGSILAQCSPCYVSRGTEPRRCMVVKWVNLVLWFRIKPRMLIQQFG